MKTPVTILVVSMLAAAGLHAAPNTNTASMLFERHFAAAGGRDACEKVETVIVRGTGREGAAEFDFEISQKTPGCILFVISNTAAQKVMRIGRDDNAKFWQDNPELGLREVPKAEQGEYMEVAIGLFPPSILFFSEQLDKSPFEEKQDQGMALMVVGSGSKGAIFPQLSFDKATGLLSRVSKVQLEDYRSVNGVKLPFLIKPDEKSEFKIKEIVVNAPLSETVFRSPGVAKAGINKGEGAAYEIHTMPGTKLGIVRKPAPARFGRGALASLPKYASNSMAHAQVDLRGYDLRKLDFSQRLNDLLHADFDDQTRWPSTLPAGFDRERVVALGKDPGLGIRKLHEQGLKGKGIAIGIIDQALLVDHVEYADRLKLYEEIHNPPRADAQMHGPAVASIAVGKTVGVAPEADLYYIAETHGVFHPGKDFDWDFTWLAQSIDRLLEINSTLPKEKKIRVISISVGWSPGQKGFKEAMNSVKRASEQGVFVVSTAISMTHKLRFHGLGREALSDPNDIASVQPGGWWAPSFWAGQTPIKPGETLLVPMDCRTTASPTGANEYVYYSTGGWSWSVPWISGLYALACEVKPNITPEAFWAKALETGKTVTLKHNGKEVQFGTVVDPVALIECLRTK